MKKQSFIYGMLMATSFLACENELPFRDKPQEPQLLMNAFLEAGKEKNEVFLHIVDGNGTTSFLEGAIIVYINDEKTEETDVKGGSYMSKYTVQSRFCPGDRIRLEAALEGGKYQGSAEVRIPQPIEEAIRVDTLRTQLKVGVSMQVVCVTGLPSMIVRAKKLLSSGDREKNTPDYARRRDVYGSSGAGCYQSGRHRADRRSSDYIR